MFDIGGWEFLIIVVIAIVVIGPKDLPGTIRTVTGWIRRARELAREFQSGLDDIARDAELSSMKEELQSGLGVDQITDAGNSIRREIENSIDPDNEIKNALTENPMPPDDDDPFLADYREEEDEDDELDDIDPKYKTADRQRPVEPRPPEEEEQVEPEGAEAVKKA